MSSLCGLCVFLGEGGGGSSLKTSQGAGVAEEESWGLGGPQWLWASSSSPGVPLAGALPSLGAGPRAGVQAGHWNGSGLGVRAGARSNGQVLCWAGERKGCIVKALSALKGPFLGIKNT